MLRYILWFPGWLTICTVLAVVFSLPVRQESIFLGIPPAEVIGEIDLMQVGKWTALCSVPLLANGVILERSHQIELFSVLRVKKRLFLRGREVYACVACTFAWAVGVFGVSAWQLGSSKAIRIFFLLLPNLLLWDGISLVSYALCKRTAWSGGISLALIGGSCLIGVHLPSWMRYLPSTWGMLSQTGPYNALGSLPLMSAASSLSAIVCYFVFIIYEGNENGNHRN